MKNLYLIIGPSGSGKTTLERNLAHCFDAKTVRSYTTRPPRRDGDTDHYYVTDAEFDALGELVAFTEYNGYRYGVTKDILDKSDFYVIDPAGALGLFERYKERPVFPIWIHVDPTRCAIRMAAQGRAEKDIIQRLDTDASAFDWNAFGNLAAAGHPAYIIDGSERKDGMFLAAANFVSDMEKEGE